jgi:ABC-type phosphate/phosphonate transport system permease subunit
MTPAKGPKPTAAQVIIVVATVVAIDMLSARIRKHLV